MHFSFKENELMYKEVISLAESRVDKREEDEVRWLYHKRDQRLVPSEKCSFFSCWKSVAVTL